MPLPWIKMWLEGLDDPKLTRLSLAERGAWWGLLKLAGKCEADGKMVSGGAGLDMDEIADALHIKTDDDRQALESMMAKMEKRGSVKWNDKVLLVVHYEERQRIPPSAQPAAVAERVRRYRERQKKEKTPIDVEEVNKDNRYRTSIREELKKYKEKHGEFPVGDDLETIKERLELEIYGRKDKEQDEN